MFKISYSAIILTLVVFVSACGGGSGSENTVTPPKVTPTPQNTLPSTDAGPDQTVDELSDVTLLGSASDSDGSITDYQWTQTSGPAVQLVNSDTVSPGFTAPEVSDPVVLVFQLLATDNDGGSASDTVSVTVENIPVVVPPNATVSGKVTYDDVTVSEQGHDYANLSRRAVRGASINLIDIDGNIVASTDTDENGDYQITAPKPDVYSVEVVAGLGSESQGNYVSVRDNFSATDTERLPNLTDIYRFVILPPQEVSSSVDSIDYHAELKWNPSSNSYEAGREAPVFALLDQAYDMQSLLKSWNTDYQFDPLYIFWNENNVAEQGVWWEGQIPNSAFAGNGTNALFVASDDEKNIDEYDRTLIAHELGHFVLTNLTRDETLGGSHSLQSVMDHRQAFAEGFSSYFAWLLTGSDELINSDGQADGITDVAKIFINPIDTFNKGWFFENVNSDVLRNVTEGNATYGLPEKGFAFVFNVLAENMKQSDALITVHSFLGNSIKRDPELGTYLSDFATSKGITSVDEWAENETFMVPEVLTINEQEHTYLPLYRDMQLGIPSEICLNDVVAGSANRLGVFSYLKLTIPEAGDYIVEWRSEQGAPLISSRNRLGERFLYGGGLDDNAVSNLYGSQVQTDIPAELNVISVSFYGNQFPGADPRAPRVSSGCITLTISKV